MIFNKRKGIEATKREKRHRSQKRRKAQWSEGGDNRNKYNKLSASIVLKPLTLE